MAELADMILLIKKLQCSYIIFMINLTTVFCDPVQFESK